MRITENTKINYIVKKNGSTFKIFWKYGMYNAGHPLTDPGTVKEICKLYDVEPDELIEELRRADRRKYI